MKYCSTTTRNHPISILYPSCIVDINLVITREGYNGSIPLFINNEVVMNLDVAERRVASGEKRIPNKSMDMSFGIKNEDSSIIEILMVELRFNYTNIKNVTRQYLEEKVAGSLLVLGGSITVCRDYIFIFQSNLKAQAENRFFRMNPRIGSNYIIKDIHELKAIYFD